MTMTAAAAPRLAHPRPRPALPGRLLGASLALPWALLLATPAAAERRLIDRGAAVVEDEVILLSDVERRAAAASEPGAAGRRQALEDEIDERLMARAVARQRSALAVTEADVDRLVESVCTNNRTTAAGLAEALRQQGMSMPAYRDKLRAQIERARLVQARVQAHTPVGDGEVRRRCLAEHKVPLDAVVVCASHILVAIPEAADPAARQAAQARADRLRQRLVAGADFAAVAREQSDDTGSPDGVLGCFRRGEMLESFERAAFSLQPGELSEVVATEVGLHLVRVDERRAEQGNLCDQADIQQATREAIFQEAMQVQMQQLVEEHRRGATINRRGGL